jgi:hypothetical protein
MPPRTPAGSPVEPEGRVATDGAVPSWKRTPLVRSGTGEHVGAPEFEKEREENG